MAGMWSSDSRAFRAFRGRFIKRNAGHKPMTNLRLHHLGRLGRLLPNKDLLRQDSEGKKVGKSGHIEERKGLETPETPETSQSLDEPHTYAGRLEIRNAHETPETPEKRPRNARNVPIRDTRGAFWLLQDLRGSGLDVHLSPPRRLRLSGSWTDGDRAALIGAAGYIAAVLRATEILTTAAELRPDSVTRAALLRRPADSDLTRRVLAWLQSERMVRRLSDPTAYQITASGLAWLCEASESGRRVVVPPEGNALDLLAAEAHLEAKT